MKTVVMIKNNNKCVSVPPNVPPKNFGGTPANSSWMRISAYLCHCATKNKLKV
jgi:hypothetical protein